MIEHPPKVARAAQEEAPYPYMGVSFIQNSEVTKGRPLFATLQLGGNRTMRGLVLWHGSGNSYNPPKPGTVVRLTFAPIEYVCAVVTGYAQQNGVLLAGVRWTGHASDKPAQFGERQETYVLGGELVVPMDWEEVSRVQQEDVEVRMIAGEEHGQIVYQVTRKHG